jgi:hypothetical protein
MATRKLVAWTLAVGLAAGSLSGPVSGQENGIIGGTATAEAKKPYTNYSVQLRDAATAQVVKTGSLDPQGLFSFTGVGLTRRLIVELVDTRQGRVVCTEGPYVLTTAASARNDVKINCGATPAAWWLLLAGAGAASGIAVLQASGG